MISPQLPITEMKILTFNFVWQTHKLKSSTSKRTRPAMLRKTNPQDDIPKLPTSAGIRRLTWMTSVFKLSTGFSPMDQGRPYRERRRLKAPKLR
jgi:hypothetical protein